jgi:ABC-type multidrug transport system ATPase subunit
MLVIDSLCKRLGPREVLRDVSLRVEAPQIVWLRGPNGCGKSTLLKCVAGVWRPDRGDVLVYGRSTVRDGRARGEVGYVPDRFAPFPELSVSEMLGLVAALKRSPSPSAALLDRFALPGFAHQSVASLSAGQTRRAALVAGLIGDPWLLVLDEPTTGLDAEGVELLRDTLCARRRAGKAALLVTHDRSFASDVEAAIYDFNDGTLVPGEVPCTS